MASLYIAEFSYQGSIEGQALGAVVKGPPAAEQKLTIGTSVSSAAFHAGCSVIRLNAEAACSVAFAAALVGPNGASPPADPVATTANMRFAANQTEYFEMKGPGKVAVITNT